MSKKIRRAIISVSDKTGIVDFAKTLQDLGVKILSTGGTAKTLMEAGIEVTEVSDYTGFPEILDGRVKTLHPKIHGGLLALRDNPDHMKTLQEHGIEPIDMVVVNLYPFEKTIAKEGVTFHEAIENIDIGGPTMLRAAAKNFGSVVVVVDPADYDCLKEELINLGGEVSYRTRARLAWKVFETTSRYDRAIADYLKSMMQE
ncbi:MAG: IMP cyclohydrolase [Nitrospirae bacterium]|nr:MAG: IMP cyclohydrolase [Nitrospirota bacterium]